MLAQFQVVLCFLSMFSFRLFSSPSNRGIDICHNNEGGTQPLAYLLATVSSGLCSPY